MRLHYWREEPHEVDFVLRRGPRLVAVEVKSGEVKMPHRGMDEFEQRFARSRRLFVGEGEIPLNEFLTGSAREWFEEAWA